MESTAWLVFVASLGGIAVALQAQFMGVIDRGLGTLEAVFINYVGGALLIGVVLLVLRGGNLANWPTLPWYTLIVGVTGLVIVRTGAAVRRRLHAARNLAAGALRRGCGALLRGFHGR
jgi:transporter family-2 protein